ncbi:primosomal protein N', partial [candidate division KSB1 bacterium]
QCRECGYIEQCKNCSITLTFHKYEKRLKCHYCGYTLAPPVKCPGCKGENIFYPGAGTQKLEEEIREKVPGYSLIRVDSDILSSKKRFWQISKDIQNGKYSIILGTQIISKGLDLHNLNFVGVINADIGLFLPDFRASERTFQLLTQVSGRAGRREERGEVVIQTYNPENIALISSRKHDFELLYNNIINSRKELGYPPFSRLILIRFKHGNAKICEKESREFAAELKKSNIDAQILGPSPSVLFKVQNNYRFQILIKIRNRSSKNLKLIKSKLKWITEELKTIKSRLSIDIDPFDMV